MSGKITRTRCESAACPRGPELARLEERQEALEERIGSLCEGQERLLSKLDELIPAVARLEVKSGIWGGVGGVLAALAVIAATLAGRL